MEKTLKEKDATERALEAFDDVFADIINGLLFGGRQIIHEQKLTDAQPFSTYKADGCNREQERDVSKYWMDESGRQINVRLALFGIENQTGYDRDMPLRVIGYDGAAYRAELSRKERSPVITLVLYFGDRPWGKNRSIYDVISVAEEFKPYVNDYKIHVFEIARLPETAIQDFHSDFKVVVDYFVHRRNNPDYRPKDPDAFRHTDAILKLMSVMTQDARFVETLQGEGGKPRNMCEVLDRVEEKGIEKGIEKGMEKGIEKGADNARIDSIKKLMKNLKITAAQAMDILEIPLPERKKYYSRI